MVLGIDPGTATVGFALVEGTKKNPVIVKYGVLQTKAAPSDQLPFRILEICNDLEELIKLYEPTRCVMEELFYFKNQKTVMSVAQSRGAMMYLMAKNGIEIMGQTPLQVKQTLCGYGRATKQQMQKMVQKIYKLEAIPKPDDAADALAMAWMALK